MNEHRVAAGPTDVALGFALALPATAALAQSCPSNSFDILECAAETTAANLRAFTGEPAEYLTLDDGNSSQCGLSCLPEHLRRTNASNGSAQSSISDLS